VKCKVSFTSFHTNLKKVRIGFSFDLFFADEWDGCHGNVTKAFDINLQYIKECRPCCRTLVC